MADTLVTAKGRVRPAAAAGLAVLVVAALVALVAVLGRQTAEPPAAPAPRPHVDVVGDSLVHQASAPLRAGLDEAGFAVSVVGLPGQGLSGPGVRARLDELVGVHADVLVVATTTNDVRDFAADADEPAASAYRVEIEALVERFSDRCVVLVNARDRTSPVYRPERVAVLNAELAALARDHPGLVVVDWAALSRDLPEDWFSPDQLHFGRAAEEETPGSPSARVYAGAIVGGVRRCHARGSTAASTAP